MIELQNKRCHGLGKNNRPAVTSLACRKWPTSNSWRRTFALSKAPVHLLSASGFD